ncbi:hypothetical protein [Neobacillus sp. NPDC093127]|uniref:hypothetical protein n=1 Tax=Neobacillus sp. NPDC093127 TaxID=3364296 RepID=UPI003810EFA0
MKKIIALSSFLLLLLMAVLPAGVSHAASTTASSVQVDGITFYLANGEKITATKNGSNFTLDLVGDEAFGEKLVKKIEITSKTAVRLSVLPANFDYREVAPLTKDDFDIQFVNGVAVLDAPKLLNWAKRIGGNEDVPVGETPDTLFSIGEIKYFWAPFLASVFDYGEESPFVFSGYVVDKDGKESTVTLTIKTKGWVSTGKAWKYLDEFGEYQTGWLLDGNKWYYFGADGVMKTGWIKSGSKWYFLNPSGAMATGWVQDKGKWYYLNVKNGDMATGWAKVSNKWYFLDASGAMQTGWVKSGGKWYFLNSSGAMATGWAKVSNKWYYLDASGAMKTGWVKVSNKWYYLDGSGAMKTGWVEVSKKWYYLYSDGHMAANTKIGSYRVGADGAWIK